MTDEITKPSTEQPPIESIKQVRLIREFPNVKIEYIVENLLVAGTLNLYCGEPGSGKSTIITAMCHAIDHGLPFLGLETQKRPILILDRENSLPGIADRMARIGAEDSDTFKIWGGWEVSEPPVPWDKVVLQWIATCELPPIIVVDSYLAFHPGDENSASDTRSYMGHFRRMADQGVTIILIHHTGKAGTSKKYRGSSDIEASVDMAFTISNFPKGPKLNRITVKPFKTRISIMDEFMIRYLSGLLQIDGQATSVDYERLRNLLIGNPEISAQQFEKLAKQQDISRDDARAFLWKGKQEGKISVTRGAHNSVFHTWLPLSSRGEKVV